MKDAISKDTGNGYLLKGSSPPATYDEFKTALTNGTLPVDINYNASGWQVEGTPLNKANLLTDTTSENLGLDPTDDPTVDDAFNNIFRLGDIKYSTRADLGNKWALCDGTIIHETDNTELYAILTENFIASKSNINMSNKETITMVGIVNTYAYIITELNNVSKLYVTLFSTLSNNSTWSLISSGPPHKDFQYLNTTVSYSRVRYFDGYYFLIVKNGDHTDGNYIYYNDIYYTTDITKPATQWTLWQITSYNSQGASSYVLDIIKFSSKYSFYIQYTNNNSIFEYTATSLGGSATEGNITSYADYLQVSSTENYLFSLNTYLSAYRSLNGGDFTAKLLDTLDSSWSLSATTWDDNYFYFVLCYANYSSYSYKLGRISRNYTESSTIKYDTNAFINTLLDAFKISTSNASSFQVSFPGFYTKGDKLALIVYYNNNPYELTFNKSEFTTSGSTVYSSYSLKKMLVLPSGTPFSTVAFNKTNNSGIFGFYGPFIIKDNFKALPLINNDLMYAYIKVSD